jgi:hypothetical protein
MLMAWVVPSQPFLVAFQPHTTPWRGARGSRLGRSLGVGSS